MPPKRIEETAIGQVNSHGVDGKITPPEVSLDGPTDQVSVSETISLAQKQDSDIRS